MLEWAQRRNEFPPPGQVRQAFAGRVAGREMECLMKRRVLVVDDEPRIRNILLLNLRLSGYEVMCASNGSEAIEMVRVHAPDVMLLDLMMPDMDGCAVIKRVRAFSTVPILVFSASPERAESAVRLGANGCIGKPFIPTELIQRIDCLAQGPSADA